MELLLFIPLSRLIWYDYKKRRVKIADLLLFGGLQFLIVWIGEGWKELVFRLEVNLGVVIWMAGGLVLYDLIRYRQWERLLRRQAGIGDLWFCLLLAPAFTLRAYVFFLTFAFFLTLCIWGIYSRRSRRRVTIPLVSGVGLLYMVFLTIRFCNHG